MSWFNGRRTKDWTCTFSGVRYYPRRPRVQDVRIVDIAHHLSRICRFTGAVRVEHYSVAEHCVLGSRLFEDPWLAFIFLMHDAEEAYVTDVSRPLKRSWLMWGYRRIAARNWKVIAQKFGLPLVLPAAVHVMDERMYRAEIASLMPPIYDDGYDHVPAADVEIQAWGADRAEEEFLRRFHELTYELTTRWKRRLTVGSGSEVSRHIPSWRCA